jgi:hypothetical protein
MFLELKKNISGLEVRKEEKERRRSVITYFIPIQESPYISVPQC